MCICCFACVWSFRLNQELHKRFSYCKNALWCKHSAQDVLFLCLTAWGHVPSQSLIMSLALFSVRYSKEAALWPALAHTWHLFSVFIRLFSINVWPLWRCEEFWDALPSSVIKMWPWTTKPVISSTGIFVAIVNFDPYIVWVKIIDFSFMPKIIRILSKDHVPWRYFVNFLL